jgi:hypothetical protein
VVDLPAPIGILRAAVAEPASGYETWPRHYLRSVFDADGQVELPVAADAR